MPPTLGGSVLDDVRATLAERLRQAIHKHSVRSESGTLLVILDDEHFELAIDECARAVLQSVAHIISNWNRALDLLLALHSTLTLMPERMRPPMAETLRLFVTTHIPVRIQ